MALMPQQPNLPYSPLGPQSPMLDAQDPLMMALMAQQANTVPQAPQALTQDVGGGTYEQAASDIAQRKRLAQALMEQSQQPMQTNQMAGRFVVPISPMQGLAKVAQAGLGGYMDSQAAKKESEVAANQNKALTAILRNPNATEEEIYAALATDPALSPELRTRGLTQGFESRMAKQKAKAEAEADAKKQAYQEQRDTMLEEGRNLRAQAQQAGLESRLGMTLMAQADMLDRRLAQMNANRPADPITAVTLQDPNDPNATIVVDGRTGRQIGKGPKQSDIGKATAPKLSAKQRQVASDKIQTVQTLKGQLQKLKDAWTGVKGTYSAGIGQGYLPTPEGQAFDAASKNMSSFIRQLTRTPGEGAMSDYESRLAQSILPVRTSHETVTEQQIRDLEDLITGIETGYTNILNPEGSDDAVSPQTGGADLGAAARAELERRRAASK